MSVKKLLGRLAWVLLSTAFFSGPFLLAKGLLPSWIGLAIALIPCIAIIFFTFNRLQTKQSKTLFVVTIPIAFYGLLDANLLRPELVFLANFTLINGFLFWVFSRTLSTGSIPLCTRFADLVHDKMSPEVASYSRGLTIAWSLFFALQPIVWLVLFVTLEKSYWYQLVTIVPPCLIIVLFLADWVFRQCLLPYEDKKDAIQLTIKALIKHRHILGKTITK